MLKLKYRIYGGSCAKAKAKTFEQLSLWTIGRSCLSHLKWKFTFPFCIWIWETNHNNNNTKKKWCIVRNNKSRIYHPLVYSLTKQTVVNLFLSHFHNIISSVWITNLFARLIQVRVHIQPGVTGRMGGMFMVEAGGLEDPGNMRCNCEWCCINLHTEHYFIICRIFILFYLFFCFSNLSPNCKTFLYKFTVHRRWVGGRREKGRGEREGRKGGEGGGGDCRQERRGWFVHREVESKKLFSYVSSLSFCILSAGCSPE